MPYRIPNATVVIARKDPNNPDQKVRVQPKTGEKFMFTQAEIDDIEGQHPGALSRVVAEVDDEDEAETPAAGASDESAETMTPAEKKAAEKKAKAEAEAAAKAAKTDDEDL